MEIIGQRLKQLRESVGLSQNKLGKLMGLRQSSVNRYEAAESTPPAHILIWYADYFDVSLDYIFGRTDDPQGKLYENRPKLEPEMAKFVDMCFKEGTAANRRLKESLIQMINDTREGGAS